MKITPEIKATGEKLHQILLQVESGRQLPDWDLLGFHLRVLLHQLGQDATVKSTRSDEVAGVVWFEDGGRGGVILVWNQPRWEWWETSSSMPDSTGNVHAMVRRLIEAAIGEELDGEEVTR